MTLVYRGMKPAVSPSVGPLVADDDANALGVRTDPPSKAKDVTTYQQNEVPWVSPTESEEPQGISVASGSGCNLPAHRRPRGDPWNGTGNKDLQMWQLDGGLLTPAQLAVQPAPLEGQPEHKVIAPGQRMALSTYREYIAATAGHWVKAPVPDRACPAPKIALGVDAMEPQLEQLTDATASGKEPAELVAALVEANGRGVSASTLVAGVEAAIARAETAGNDDGAEALRTVLDRATGYCAPSDRIELT